MKGTPDMTTSPTFARSAPIESKGTTRVIHSVNGTELPWGPTGLPATLSGGLGSMSGLIAAAAHGTGPAWWVDAPTFLWGGAAAGLMALAVRLETRRRKGGAQQAQIAPGDFTVSFSTPGRTAMDDSFQATQRPKGEAPQEQIAPDDFTAPARVLSRAAMDERFQAAKRLFQEVATDAAQYTLDPEFAFSYPGFNDVRNAYASAYAKAFGRAQRAVDAHTGRKERFSGSAEDLAAVEDAVNEYRLAFNHAEDCARAEGQESCTEEERRIMGDILAVMRRLTGGGNTPSERGMLVDRVSVLTKRLRQICHGRVVPDQVLDALEASTRAALEGGTTLNVSGSYQSMKTQ